MNLKRVVVTGLGALTPIGNNIDDYWNALVAGKSGCAPVSKYVTGVLPLLQQEDQLNDLH